MNLQSNDFELFDLPMVFALDSEVLGARWKDLQREVHPDRHTAADAQTRRQAMQWSVRINEAYQRLKDPLRRAAYLCELNGSPIQAENNTAMPPAFLMQQMAWREALEEAKSAATVENLADDVAGTRSRMLAELQQTADARRDWPALAQQVRALMFVERFVQDVETRLEQLGQ